MWHLLRHYGKVVGRHGVMDATFVACVPSRPRAIGMQAGGWMLGVAPKPGNPVDRFARGKRIWNVWQARSTDCDDSELPRRGDSEPPRRQGFVECAASDQLTHFQETAPIGPATASGSLLAFVALHLAVAA